MLSFRDWTARLLFHYQDQISAINSHLNLSRICIIGANGVTIFIDDAVSTDKILRIKQRVFAANRKLFVRRQRLVYRAGPRGMEKLDDDDALGGAGVA